MIMNDFVLFSDSCMLPTQSGSCSDRLTRYSYDSNDGLCKPFIYSGCEGNTNNFDSQAKCEDNCAAEHEQGTDSEFVTIIEIETFR